MNDTTRDELTDYVADELNFVNSEGMYSEANIRTRAERVVARITAARDAEIVERLLSDRAKNASAHEMQELSAQGVTHNHTLAFYGMKAALAAIGLSKEASNDHPQPSPSLGNPTYLSDVVIRHLWQAADDPEVMRQVADELNFYLLPDDGTSEKATQAAITATLTALIGPRPQGERR